MPTAHDCDICQPNKQAAMTAGELMAALQSVPPETKVFCGNKEDDCTGVVRAAYSIYFEGGKEFSDFTLISGSN